MADSTLTILRPSIWNPVFQRLKEASVDAVYRVSRNLLVRPLELLSFMATEAPAALADDALAAERLRMLLFLAAPFADNVHEAERLRNDSLTPAPYDPSVINHGALALLALAAIRVEPPGCRGALAKTVHGLALAAAPVEVLGRLVPQLPDPQGIAVILETLFLLKNIDESAKASWLGRFAEDPVERGRWRCLEHLFKSDLPGALAAALEQIGGSKEEMPWEGGDSALIDEVRQDPKNPFEVTLGGRFGSILRGTALKPGLVVVFASAEAPPLASHAVGVKGGELRVDVPLGAGEGWIGFSDDAQAVRANHFRQALKNSLPLKIERLGCVRGADVPVKLIGEVGVPDPKRPSHWLARPPRTASNRWPGLEGTSADGEVSRWRAMPFPGDTGESAHTAPPREQPPQPASSASRTEPVHIDVRVLQGELEERFCLGKPLEVEIVVDQPVRKVSLALDGDEGKQAVPIEIAADSPQRRFVLSVPPSRCHDGMAGTVVVDTEDRHPAGRTTLGPLAFDELREARLVLVRPQVLSSEPEPIIEDREWVVSLLRYVGAQLGLDPVIEELPWVDDELAVLTSELNSAADARIPLLLEALARRAMVTPHLESATWLCVVPLPLCSRKEDDKQKVSGVFKRAEASFDDWRRVKGIFERAVAAGHAFERSEPAEAARAVAVATWPALAELLKKLYGTKAETPLVAPTPRLRLLGTLHQDSLSLEPVQEEQRGRGHGAPLDSVFTVATVDAGGRELFVDTVKCLRTERPALLAALPPVFPSVVAVELRRGKKVLARVERVEGESAVEEAHLASTKDQRAQELRWRYKHSRNARPALSLTLGSERHKTEVLRIDACDVPARLHLSRYHDAEKIELLASDGWNRKDHEVALSDGLCLRNPTPVAIRRLADGRWFAEVPPEWFANVPPDKRPRMEISWFLGKDRIAGPDDVPRAFALPRGARGTLRLEVRRDGQRIDDERSLPEA